MPGPTSVHTALVEQLLRLSEQRLLDPLEILLQSAEPLATARTYLRAAVETQAAQLLGRDDQLARHAAARVIGALYPGDQPFDPPLEWWRTPLGQVVARRVGHPATEAVPYSVAGAMLGVTRQGVHDLVNRHKLDRHPDGGVRTESVRARLLAREDGNAWGTT
ncbi:acyl-CoA-like ligand-binding transcription factor [Crossiella sp. NPDC003009]